MEHDASYKLLFSHTRMVEDLLQGFVHEAWVRDVDCTTLERVSDSYISDDLHSRRDDLDVCFISSSPVDHGTDDTV